jgi:hypothetical protein
MAQKKATATEHARDEWQQAYGELRTIYKEREPVAQRALAAWDELREWDKRLEGAANHFIEKAKALEAADVQERAHKATKGRKARAKPVKA